MSKIILFLKNNSVPIVIVLMGFVISILILFRPSLDTLQKIFSILGSLSIGIALLTYFNKKRQDELFATVDQITFFREKIISEWDGVQRYVQEKNQSFISSRINLQNPNIDYVKKEFSINFDRQLGIFFDATKKFPDINIYGDVLDKQILLLNMLEEFSLRVIYLNTINNPALESVHSTFVEIVEKNAVALLFMRDIKAGNQIYSGVLTLYKLWQIKVDKINFIKNLEKFGLISKKQREEIYHKRKEKLGF